MCVRARANSCEYISFHEQMLHFCFIFCIAKKNTDEIFGLPVITSPITVIFILFCNPYFFSSSDHLCHYQRFSQRFYSNHVVIIYQNVIPFIAYK